MDYPDFARLGQFGIIQFRSLIFLNSNTLSAVCLAESDLEEVWESHGKPYKSRVWRGLFRNSFYKKRLTQRNPLCTESQFFGFRLGRGRYGNFFPNTIRGLALN